MDCVRGDEVRYVMRERRSWEVAEWRPGALSHVIGFHAGPARLLAQASAGYCRSYWI